MSTPLDQFTADLDGLRALSGELGTALLVSQAAERVGIVGGADLRTRIESVLVGRASNPPCGCHARAANPPKLSLKALGEEAAVIARRVARDTMRRVRTVSAFKLALTGSALVAPFVVWDLLVPDEATEVARVFTETAVMREQLNRLPPQDAVRLFKDMSSLYGGSSGSSIGAYVAIGAALLIIGPPLVRRALG